MPAGRQRETAIQGQTPIVVERASVAVVILNRENKKNALSLAMWRQLADIFRDLDADHAVRVIILTGRGPFCAGADISEFSEVRASVEQGEIYEHAVETAQAAIASASKPVIAAISGFCIGGGMGLAQSCDFRIADAKAVFGIPAARLGIVYGVRECSQLVSLVGATAAKRILFGGQRFDAAEAARIGFAEIAEGRTLDAARRFAEGLLDNAPLSIAGMKLIINAIAENAVGERDAAISAALRRALQSEDYKEGVEAFAARRPPNFKGS